MHSAGAWFTWHDGARVLREGSRRCTCACGAVTGGSGRTCPVPGTGTTLEPAPPQACRAGCRPGAGGLAVVRASSRCGQGFRWPGTAPCAQDAVPVRVWFRIGDRPSLVSSNGGLYAGSRNRGYRDNQPVQGWCPVQPRACAGYRDAARGQGRMPASWTRSPGPVRRGSRCPSQVSSRAKPAAGLRCPTIRSSVGVTGSGSRSGPPRLRARAVRYGGETRGLPRRTPPVFRAGENALPRE